MERKFRREQLSREAGDGVGRAVHHGCVTDCDQLHRHKPDQRDGLLLRCVSCKCERREREFG